MNEKKIIRNPSNETKPLEETKQGVLTVTHTDSISSSGPEKLEEVKIEEVEPSKIEPYLKDPITYI